MVQQQFTINNTIHTCIQKTHTHKLGVKSEQTDQRTDQLYSRSGQLQLRWARS